MELEWWHWIVLGFTLALLELAVPSFFIIWFGLAALLVGLTLLAIPLSFTAQILIFAVLSAILVVAWFRYFKPKTLTQAGSSAAQIVGEIGLLTRSVAPFERGEVRFQKPIAGSDLWPCISDDTLSIGTRVKVLAVEGSLLRIGPL